MIGCRVARWRVATGFGACLILLCLTEAPVGAAERQTLNGRPELEVLAQGPLTVSAVEGRDKAEAYVTVLNVGTAPTQISAAFQATTSVSVKASVARSTTIAPGQAERVKLMFTGLQSLRESVSGELVIRGGSRPVAQSATVSAALQPSANWPLAIVATALGFTMLVAAGLMAAVASAKTWHWLKNPAPSPKWSFGSWATHLTAVGALLGTVLGSASLPKTPKQIDKTSLVALSLLFGAVVVIAPFVFEAVRRPAATSPKQGEGGTGFVWVLLLSCALTLGAVIGEITTLGLAAWEITGGGASGVLLEVGLGILGVLALYYVSVTALEAALTDWMAAAQLVQERPAAGAPTATRAASPRPAGGDVGEIPLSVTRPPQSWSLP
jgi:hypothetical protein